jgi:hypothetical protein
MPAQEMGRAGIPGEFEHFGFYTVSVAMAAYRCSRTVWTILLFWVYVASLKCFRQFSRAGHPEFTGFATSATGASWGGLVVVLAHRFLKGITLDIS